MCTAVQNREKHGFLAPNSLSQLVALFDSFSRPKLVCASRDHWPGACHTFDPIPFFEYVFGDPDFGMVTPIERQDFPPPLGSLG